MYRKLLEQLHALEDGLDEAGECKTDSEALLRVMLANALARAARILKVLAADEEAGK